MTLSLIRGFCLSFFLLYTSTSFAGSCQCVLDNQGCPCKGECKCDGCKCGKDCSCKPGKKSDNCKCGDNCPCAKGKCPCVLDKKTLVQGRAECFKTGKPLILWVGCRNQGLESKLSEFVHCYEEKVPGLPCPCVAVSTIKVEGLRGRRVYPAWRIYSIDPLPTEKMLRAGVAPIGRPRFQPVPVPYPVPYPVPQPVPSREWTTPDRFPPRVSSC